MCKISIRTATNPTAVFRSLSLCISPEGMLMGREIHGVYPAKRTVVFKDGGEIRIVGTWEARERCQGLPDDAEVDGESYIKARIRGAL